MAKGIKEVVRRVKLGVVGVDSGQLVLCDPSYIDDQWDKEDQEFDNPKKNFSYAACSKKTIDADYHSDDQGQLNFEMGHAGVGVAFRSGIGDGCYEVYGYLKNLEGWGERLVKVEVILVEEESEKFEKLTEHLIGIKPKRKKNEKTNP